MIEDEVYDFIFKLVIIGDSFVGKTNIMSQYLNKEFHIDSKATVGVEFGSKKFIIDGKLIKAQIWDTAGQERYKAITNAYYKGSVGAFVVYDITRKESFNSVDKWIKDVREVSDKNVILLLIGNKCDLEEQRQVTKKQGEEKAKANEVAFLETSALNGENLDKAFDIMIKEVYNKNHNELEGKNENNKDDINDNGGIDLNYNKKSNVGSRKKCCKK